MKSKSSILKAQVPRAFLPLLSNARYKGVYGGRGGAKSHFFAERLVLKCYSTLIRAVCIREVQNSLKESVKQLIEDKIVKFGLGSFFDILEGEIRGANGSLIIFKGMQTYNAENIKSLEGFDIAWIEEAQTLSAHSLRMLRPTIRKDNSEIWASWNPRHDTDPIDVFFRGHDVSPDTVCVRVNWNQNPWFPDVLRAEMERDRANDPEMAEHVWDGGYLIASEGAYYAKALFDAEKQGRIGDYRHLPDVGVMTSWDIGVDDYTAIWFFQRQGKKIRVIDYFETSGEGAPEIVATALPELVKDDSERAINIRQSGRLNSYRYERHFLPHDVKVREWGGGAKERSMTLIQLGVKPLVVGVAKPPAERINAARQLLSICYFDNNPRVQIGLKKLRKYSRKFNNSMQTYTTPLHDENSHAADAFGEFAVNCGMFEIVEEKTNVKKPRDYNSKDDSGELNWKTV